MTASAPAAFLWNEGTSLYGPPCTHRHRDRPGPDAPTVPALPQLQPSTRAPRWRTRLLQPCLVALNVFFQAPNGATLCPAVRAHAQPLADVSGYRSEQLRAMHTFDWAAPSPEPGPSAHGLAPRGYDSRTDFYSARGGYWSGEADFGYNHTAAGLGFRGPCAWHVAVVASTGDVYATDWCNCDDHAPVLLLGSTRPGALDRDSRDADTRFDGWAITDVRDLTWFRARAAVPYRVVSPPTAPFRTPLRTPMSLPPYARGGQLPGL